MNRIFIALIVAVAVTGCGAPDQAAETADKTQAAEAGHEGEAGHAEGEAGHEEEAPGELDIDAERISRAGIQTEAAGPAEIRQTLSLFGTITVDPARTRDVAARFPGLVKSVRVNLGDRVAAGVGALLAAERGGIRTGFGDLLELAGAEDRVDLRNLALEVVAVPLDEAASDDEFFERARLL